jgi:hypothetical protein
LPLDHARNVCKGQPQHLLDPYLHRFESVTVFAKGTDSILKSARAIDAISRQGNEGGIVTSLIFNADSIELGLDEMCALI